MRRAHSSRRTVRFWRRWATSSRSSAALVSGGGAPSPGRPPRIQPSVASGSRGAPGSMPGASASGRGLGPTTSTAMSSRGRPPAASSTASWIRWATVSAAEAAAAREQRGEVAVAEDLLATGPDLGDPVGVEHDQLARRELDLDVGEHRVDVGPEQRAQPPDGLDHAGVPHHERQRVPAAGQDHARARVADLEVAVGDGAEAAVVARVAQRAVQQREHRAGPRLVGRRRAQRVARERGDRRRLGTLAADVSDQRGDTMVAGREEVVEVAADLDPLARRDEAHRRGQARRWRGCSAAAASAAAPARCGARAYRPATWRSPRRRAGRAGRGSPRRAG